MVLWTVHVEKEGDKLPGTSAEQMRRWSLGTWRAFREDQEGGSRHKLVPPQLCLTPSPHGPY